MRRHLPTLLALVLMLAPALTRAERKEVHILSANDMHANIQAFPQLTAVADSLRSLYPQLLILSAGDNRTGEPLNDLYQPAAYPMVALMNQVGFHATALGNHEFDSGPEGLARLINLSTFSYLCANIKSDPGLKLHTRPCQVFDVEGVKVGIVGVVQLGTHGIPDTHPDNCKGLSFTPAKETVAQYEWMRKECDVFILLSHVGYEGDVEIAQEMPWFDLIVGGHTHTQIDGGETHNGVLITQNANRLNLVTHTTLVVEDGKVVEKKAENIDVRNFPNENKVVADMVRFFSDNPEFYKDLTRLETPFTTYDQLGCMMTDAFVAETDADIAIENAGGIRYESHPAGSFTVSDVLRLDPFGNKAVLMELNGRELHDMIISCYENDDHGFPSISGIKCEVTFDKKDTLKIKKLALFTPDGKKLNMKGNYRVVTNSYVASVADSPRRDQGQTINRQTSDLIMEYLRKQPSINYEGVSRITFKK